VRVLGRGMVKPLDGVADILSMAALEILLAA